MTPRAWWFLVLAVAGAASAQGPAPDLCEVARHDDFKDAGLARLEAYVEDLVRSRGAPAGLDSRDVSLAMAMGEPKLARGGVTAGEISCGADGGPPYRIALYPSALEGRPLAVAYNTAAHEFQHILQVRRDHLPCGVHGEDALQRYEAEAKAVADDLVPACRDATAASSTQR